MKYKLSPMSSDEVNAVFQACVLILITGVLLSYSGS